jgi:hypothetical protein
MFPDHADTSAFDPNGLAISIQPIDARNGRFVASGNSGIAGLIFVAPCAFWRQSHEVLRRIAQPIRLWELKEDAAKSAMNGDTPAPKPARGDSQWCTFRLRTAWKQAGYSPESFPLAELTGMLSLWL